MFIRQRAFKCSWAAGLGLGLLGVSGCLISFDGYAEGDVCDAARDAGIRSSTAPDPVLRGCDAAPQLEPDANGEAGAGGSP